MVKTDSKISLFGVVVLSASLYLPALSKAADLDVCPTCSYNSIQAAIDAALPGDRVIVGSPGRTLAEQYNENIVMKSGVDVVSEGDNSQGPYSSMWSSHVTTALLRANLTIINGNGSDAVVSFPDTISVDVTLDGFTIQDINTSASGNMALVDINANAPIIRNNIIRNNTVATGSGIYLVSNSSKGMISPLIENNIIHYIAGPGIKNGDLTAAQIVGNEIFPGTSLSVSMGITLANAASPTIRNNTIFDAMMVGIGSVLDGVTPTGSPIVIKGNRIHGTEQAGIFIRAAASGVQLEVGGLSAGDSNHIHNTRAGLFVEGMTPGDVFDSVLIQRNNIDNNFVGLRLEDIATLTVSQNDLTNASTWCGLRVIDSQTVNINTNEIYGNAACGVSIEGGTPNVSIKDNHIYANGRAGIRIDANANGIISRNDIYQNGYGGIGLQSDGSLEISRNRIVNNIRGGIHTGRALADGGGFLGTPGGLALVIRQNEINDNGLGGLGAGIDVRHASGSIYNNVIVGNHNSGIRYGDWIGEIVNNTVYGNGLLSNMGGGIVYDDLLGPIQEMIGSMTPPEPPYPTEMVIRNNLTSKNNDAGIRDGICWRTPDNPPPPAPLRDFNIYFNNNNTSSCQCIPGQTGFPYEDCLRTFCIYEQTGGSGCIASPGEVFRTPALADPDNHDFTLLAGSPAIDAGDPDPLYNDLDGSRNDMGALGGPTPIDYIFPGITGVYGRVGSTDLLVKFTRGIYSNADGTGDLFANSFMLTDQDDQRNITLLTHTAGDNSAMLTLSSALDGSDDIGFDTLNAVANSVYDALGEAMDTTPVTITEALPTISNLSPANGASAVPWDSQLSFTLSDISGIDWSTFSIQLSGDLGYAQTYTSADTSVVSTTGTAEAYQVTVEPLVSFGHNEVISVIVNVDNLLGGSITPPTWSFTAFVPNPLVIHPSGLESVFSWLPPANSWISSGDWADVLDSDDGALTGVDSYATSNATQFGYQPEQEKPTNFNLHMDDVGAAAPIGTINQITVSAVVKPLQITANPSFHAGVLICYTLPSQGERCSQEIAYSDYYYYSGYGQIWYSHNLGFPLTMGDDYKELVFIDTNVGTVTPADLNDMQVRIWTFANVEWNPAFSLHNFRVHTTEVFVSVDYTATP